MTGSADPTEAGACPGARGVAGAEAVLEEREKDDPEDLTTS